MKNIHLTINDTDFFKFKELKLNMEKEFGDITWEKFFISLLNK